MKLRHKLYPSAQINTPEDLGDDVRFEDYHFETKDAKLAKYLRSDENIVEVKEQPQAPDAE